MARLPAPLRRCKKCGCELSKYSRYDTCPTCSGTAEWKRNTYASYRMPAGRRCHDCGAPTPDYRCPQCWAKLRRARDLPLPGEDVD